MNEISPPISRILKIREYQFQLAIETIDCLLDCADLNEEFVSYANLMLDKIFTLQDHIGDFVSMNRTVKHAPIPGIDKPWRKRKEAKSENNDN